MIDLRTSCTDASSSILIGIVAGLFRAHRTQPERFKWKRLGFALAVIPSISFAAHAQDAKNVKIYEVNVTNDISISSGEPEIAIDPTNYRNIAIIEFAVGSKEMPANTFDPAALLEPPPAAMSNAG